MSAKSASETPLMKQYAQIKARYPGALLLFRVGDFYETFGEDAVQCSKVLGITLTKRANGAASETALAGFPHHSLDQYLPRLVRSGLRVAVCDQTEDPKAAKGIVKREVTELVSPAVAFGSLCSTLIPFCRLSARLSLLPWPPPPPSLPRRGHRLRVRADVPYGSFSDASFSLAASAAPWRSSVPPKAT